MAAGVQLLIGSLDLWFCKIFPLIFVKEFLTYPYAASLQKTEQSFTRCKVSHISVAFNDFVNWFKWFFNTNTTFLRLMFIFIHQISWLVVFYFRV